MFSIFSAATYSPWLSLKMFFFRSTIFRLPASVQIPMSPLWSHPSSSTVSAVLSGIL